MVISIQTIGSGWMMIMMMKWRPSRALYFLVFYIQVTVMTVTADFTLIADTKVPGISLVMPMNSDALDYLTEEADMTTLSDGFAPIATEKLYDFNDDAEKAHLWCELAY